MSLEDASAALKLGSTKLTGPETLWRYETGDKEPTRPLLLRMAKAYRRPLLTFYLDSPPAQADRGEDFRTLPEARTTEDNKVDALVRDIFVRQRLIKELLEDGEEAVTLPAVGSLPVGHNIYDSAAEICQHISFNLNDFRRKRRSEDSFNYLRELVEQAGIFVLLIGNLGSHHSNISVSAFRGFALADPVAPFIVINDQYAKAAWSFTLLHELAHIFLGSTGVSGGRMEQQIEKYCNEIASQILLPAGELEQHQFDTASTDLMFRSIGDFASQRRVSGSMVAYRLWQQGRISRADWEAVSEAFHGAWVAEKERQRQKSAEKASNPDYYTVRKHKAGKALLSLVRRGIDGGLITPTKAGKVLGVSPGNVATMVGLK